MVWFAPSRTSKNWNWAAFAAFSILPMRSARFGKISV
ncbi:MAG: hypothetical protein QOF66_2189 [Mycobacterium sp.]|nr:hypothetical protein [Mycobacterium sp.]MDT5053823.1 hypothetical protein [Mycobacterium sp.]